MLWERERLHFGWGTFLTDYFGHFPRKVLESQIQTFRGTFSAYLWTLSKGGGDQGGSAKSKVELLFSSGVSLSVMCHMSSVRCQMSDVTFQVSHLSYQGNVSHVSKDNNKSQHHPLVRCHVRCQMSSVSCPPGPPYDEKSEKLSESFFWYLKKSVMMHWMSHKNVRWLGYYLQWEII